MKTLRNPLASCASLLALSIASTAFLQPSFSQQPNGATEPYQIRPEAGFGSGAQVQFEPGNFPERRQTNRQTLEQPQHVKAIVTRQMRFGIPFNITQGVSVVEAQLHLSTDQGATWNLYSRQPPQAHEFPFKTNQDGEFWFAIRTIDPNGISAPEGKLQAQMIIVVDTTDPEINFNVHTNDSGKLECWFLASDRNLNEQTLEINYRPHSPFVMNLARWKKADVEAPINEQEPGRYESRMSFWPETQSLTLDVQAKISDKAGNVSTVDRRVLLSRIVDPKQQTTSQRPPSVDPYGARQDRIAREIRWKDQSKQSVAANNNGWQSATPGKLTTKAVGGNEFVDRDLIRHKQEIASQPIHVPPRYGGGNNGEGTDARPESLYAKSGGWQSATSGDLNTSQTFNHNQGVDEDRAGQGSDPLAAFEQKSSRRIAHLASEKIQSSEYYPGSSNGADSSNTPREFSSTIPSDSIRLSNSRRFQLEYEVDSIGPEGVAQVDIWMTEDEGRSWFVWGQDQDRQSPVIVNVDNDALYGFRIGVTAKNGLSARPPRGGDDADLWIGVDTTKPNVKITSVPYGSGRDAGSLMINWLAEDRQLSAKPITLMYASHPDGPWNEIATEIENSGVYAWPISQRLPREVYLRMEARDTAGNRSVYILNNPINLAGIVPRGRIRGVQPIQ